MSVKATAKTQIDNEPDLIESLESIYGKGKISIKPEGVNVRGYSSDVKPTIIVGVDKLIGTAGYYLNPTSGKYELVYDSSDRWRLSDLIPQTDKNGNVTNRLAQVYSKIKVKKAVPSGDIQNCVWVFKQRSRCQASG